jgi:hypothetical protein
MKIARLGKQTARCPFIITMNLRNELIRPNVGYSLYTGIPDVLLNPFPV